jgi:Fe-coproporphyrin III synthase
MGFRNQMGSKIQLGKKNGIKKVNKLYNINYGLKSFISIHFVVTTKCNLHCFFCCDPPNSKEYFSFKQTKIFIDKLSKFGLKKLCITGGEPLLNPYLFKIIKFAYKKGVKVSLSSNGFKLTEEKLKKFSRYIKEVRFSLHGIEQTHDQITMTEGSYKRVINSIKIAKKLFLPVTIISTINAKNFNEMEKIAEICINNKIDKWAVFSMMKKGRAVSIYEHNYVSFQKIKNKLCEIKQSAKIKKISMEFELVDWNSEGQCVLLYSNGDLFSSPYYKSENHMLFLGNILNDSLTQMWADYPFKEKYLFS